MGSLGGFLPITPLPMIEFIKLKQAIGSEFCLSLVSSS